MRFDISKIEFSRNDLRSGLAIPREIDNGLAEFVGIMVGDGHLGRYRKNQSQAVITGNIRDKAYYQNYVNNLIFRIFNIKFNIHSRKSRNAVILSKDSKALFYFLTTVIGLPINKKSSIKIPTPILTSSDEIKSAFLRGLADADFCLTIKNKSKRYPVIHGTSNSKSLILQCSKILKELGILNSVTTESDYYAKRNKIYTRYRVYVSGLSRISKFMNTIGFSNHFKLNKYKEFTKII